MNEMARELAFVGCKSQCGFIGSSKRTNDERKDEFAQREEREADGRQGDRR